MEMLFLRVLVHILLLCATTGLSKPISTKGITIVVDVANENHELTPTATKPIHSSLRSKTVDAPSPTQPGLISTCDAFYFVEAGDYCSGIVSRFGNFTLAQFYNWNPAVGSKCSNLLAGYYVCVGVKAVPSPTQTGIASNCNEYYKVESGDTCVGISGDNNITLSDFYDWNPAVGSNCQTLIAGCYVCVGVSDASSSATRTTTVTAIVPSSTVPVSATAAPSPTQKGIVAGCTKYYQAQQGDTCVTIVKDHFLSLTVSQFESWNPAVGTDCQSLLAGYYYCVTA